MANYKAVLLKMEEQGLIRAERPGKKRRKSTFPEDILVTFPARTSRA
jgi:predicted transcriptional regulator